MRFNLMTPISESEVLATLTSSRGRIAAAAWLVTRDVHAAEDISQNIVVKALRGNNRFESAEAAIAWAFVAARREAIDWLRRRRREIPVLDNRILALLEQEWTSQCLSGGDSHAEVLQECLNDMPENSRRLVRLRYFEGHSCKEVAKEMGVGLDALYQRLSRLHRALKTCIEARRKSAEVMEV